MEKVNVLIEGENGYFGEVVKLEKGELVKCVNEVYGMVIDIDGDDNEVLRNRRFRLSSELSELVEGKEVVWKRGDWRIERELSEVSDDEMFEGYFEGRRNERRRQE